MTPSGSANPTHTCSVKLLKSIGKCKWVKNYPNRGNSLEPSTGLEIRAFILLVLYWIALL